MYKCNVCEKVFTRKDNMLRHNHNVHNGTINAHLQGDLNQNDTVQTGNTRKETFQHPFTMVLSDPIGSGKTEWTRKLFLSYLIEPTPERIIWCFGQWQPLYKELERRFPSIEFVNGIPEFINDPRYFDVGKKNLIVFDDLMTEAKCDQRIADLFTKGSHHRNLSVVYLTQNLFPQGKACRDIALNTQYLVLFNNPIDRQQVATLAKRIYPSNSGMFMKRFEQATSKPYGYLVVDLKSTTPEQDRLCTDIFESESPTTKKRKLTNEDMYDNVEKSQFTGDGDSSDIDDDSDDNDDNNDDDTFVKKRLVSLTAPPGKRFKEDLKEVGLLRDTWDRRFQEPLRHLNKDQFNAKANSYVNDGHTLIEANRLAANDLLPSLRKQLRHDYARFLIDYHRLKRGSVQPQILQSAKTLRDEHDMSFAESIRQSVKLRKDLFETLWPDHSADEDSGESDDETL